MTDADALARFETLVQSQTPAVQPWQPVTDYSVDVRTMIEGPHAELIKSTFAPTHVADYGCGHGHLVEMLRAIGVDAHGFDKVTDKYWNVHYGDLAQPWMEWVSAYDLVICREVLEHLTIREIRHAVANLCKLSTRYVYLTTRFHPKPDHLLDVATSDDLDPTHITMLNQDFLRTLFVLEGYKRRADLEAKMDWKNLGRVLVYER